MNEMKEFDVNPCFCYIGALCRNTLTGKHCFPLLLPLYCFPSAIVFTSGNTTEVSKWGECNQDTSICISKSGEKVSPPILSIIIVLSGIIELVIRLRRRLNLSFLSFVIASEASMRNAPWKSPAILAIANL